MTDEFCELMKGIHETIVNPAIALLFGLATVVFLWGLVQYVINADDQEARSTGQKHMIYGIIGMVVMVSVFGIITLILDTFGISDPASCGSWAF
jgi:uncharacterized membrane protein